MKGTPLIQTRDPDLIVRCNNLGLKLVSNLPHAITEGELGYWENHLDELKSGLRNGLSLDRKVTVLPTVEALPTNSDNTVILEWLTQWPVFCKEFGLKVELDFDALKTDTSILNRREGFNWFVYKPTGFTARNAIEILEKLKSDFTVFEEIPVEEYTSKELRPTKPHLVLCRADVEPDKDWRTSANSMRGTSVPFLDHTERYLLEAFHYWLYKKSLDIVGWTRCPRSRTSDDKVAFACRCGSKFKAYWSFGRYAYPRGGGREVVIL
jgi:hypothetical protein